MSREVVRRTSATPMGCRRSILTEVESGIPSKVLVFYYDPHCPQIRMTGVLQKSRMEVGRQSEIHNNNF